MDAKELYEAWLGQLKHPNALYSRGYTKLLIDFQASRTNIRKELQTIANFAAPDDRVIIFFAGHGYAPKLHPGRRTSHHDPNRFTWVCPRFDVRKHEKTGITSEFLYDNLVSIRGRKLVLIDACHSGSVNKCNNVRALTPEGIGPPVIAACDAQQAAYEHEKLGHGLFTYALLEALGENFRKADRQEKYGQLDVEELGTYLVRRVPIILDRVRPYMGKEGPTAQQVPRWNFAAFQKVNDHFPIALGK